MTRDEFDARLDTLEKDLRQLAMYRKRNGIKFRRELRDKIWPLLGKSTMTFEEFCDAMKLIIIELTELRHSGKSN